MPNPHTAAVDLSSLLDGSSAGELIPEMVRNGLQQLIQLELAAFLGADWHERTEERLGHRNGYRTRTLTTQVGDIALQIPLDRRSSACDNCGPAAFCPPSWSPDAGWTRPCMA
jgi:putative transposase